MISAGLVLAKMVGASAIFTGRAGMLLRTSAKFGSLGILPNAAGNLSTGLYGPFAAGPENHAPLFSRYQAPPPAGSWNTSQLVLTAYSRPLLPTAASTGSPSNTTKLAGRALWKISGGSLSSATGAGGLVSLR